MEKYLDDLCDEIDAAMFSGDSFLKEANRKGLAEYIGRWQREMKQWKEIAAEQAEKEACLES